MGIVADFLVASRIQYFATVGLDGKPKVRPFQFMLEDGGRLYFCTSNQKTVFKEMSEQPYVELCASGENFSWLRLSGKASLVKDLAIKAKVQEASPLVKGIYKTPDNPIFEVFFLSEASATMFDFSGNPPRTFPL
jgi:uncharacterized pyridoxamine 5'-phosphate oxidase family protein